MSPNVIFFSDAGPGVRWVGNERGVAGETNWNTISTDTLFAGKAGIEKILNTGSPDGKRWIPAEVDVSIRPGWFYHEKEDSLVKSAEKLFDIYLTSVGRGSTLLLNIPPDRRGLFHENDVRSLYAFKALLKKEFATNLAAKAKTTADNYRGRQKQFAPSNFNDGNKETYWATDDNVTKANIEISLNKTSTIKYIVLQEYIKLGQRVKSFTVEVWKDNQWKKLAEATTIGYKRILKIEPVTTDKIRINILDAKACPVLSNIEVY
jgi:alpha-L-fucosidase